MIKTILILLFTFIIAVNIHAQVRIHKHITTEDGLVNNRVFSMLQDSKGYFWFATSNGLSRWDGNDFENYTVKDGLATPGIFDIKEGVDGTIYLAPYGGGLTYLKNRIFKVLNKNNGLSTNWVSKIVVRKNTDISIVGIREICTLRNNLVVDTLHTIKKENRQNDIWDIYEASDNRIYIGAFNGLQILKNDVL